MKEIRKTSRGAIRNACIERNWYTCGNCEEYEKILSYADKLKEVTTDELEKIATDIKNHSDTDCNVQSIMFYIANVCCTTFIIED